MKSNFHSNQILYVKGIGYARLAIDKQKDPKNNDALKTLQNINANDPIPQENDQNTDSVLFDPDMFRIDSDSPFAQSQVEINLSQINTRKKSIQIMRRQSQQIKNRQLVIVPLKLQQCNAMIYCPETLLMKKITVIVKSLLQNCRKQIQIVIEITKTIDNFKNLILKELGQDIAYYSDIRMYATAPRLQELNIGSKTVWQCQLKDKCKITFTAKFNFTFRRLPQVMEEHFALTNGNNTLNSVQKKVQVPLPSTVTPIVPPPTLTTTNTGTSTTSVQQQKKPDQIPKTQNQPASQVKVSTQSPQKPKQSLQKQISPQKQKKPIQYEHLHLQCNAKFRSGIHYWELKVDKLNQNKDQNILLIGICMKNENSTQANEFIHLWAYDPVRCKKIEYSGQKKLKIIQKDDKQLNGSDQSDEQYGGYVKNGDAVGVLLIIKQKKATLIFYKNSVCLQECYEFDVEKLKDKKNHIYLCPFVNIKGDIQVSLDSKAIAPLDSYRFK